MNSVDRVNGHRGGRRTYVLGPVPAFLVVVVSGLAGFGLVGVAAALTVKAFMWTCGQLGCF